MGLNQIGFGLLVGGILLSVWYPKFGGPVAIAGVFLVIMTNEKKSAPKIAPVEDRDKVRCRVVDGHMVLVDDNDNVIGIAEPERKRVGCNK